MPNRLQHEQSPYLLQHKDNPVDWYAWGDEAFEKAEQEQKPIFLSIGYATCHWCHVMERESFEDEEVARLMNETFISIKVDREELPDVDNLYMTVCQLLTGRGGWPLNVLLTPDRRPFHAMTYLPKESRMGRAGMKDLVPRIQQLWEEQRDDIEQSAHRITNTLQQEAGGKGGAAPGGQVLREGFRRLAERFDNLHGGFGNAPKFPTPHNYLFLLRYWKRTGEQQARDMVTASLRSMRVGGIFDQVGFGFHRYSTDHEWKLPHFEKMLYDQAMLLWAYVEAYQASGDELFRQTAEEIIEYVGRDLTGDHGAFLCAEDADSEGEEGIFYQWTRAEIEDLLSPDDAQLVLDRFDIRQNGNFTDESTRRRTGRNVLHPVKSIETLAEKHDLEPEQVESALESARRTLFSAREKRERPLLDDKVLADWNGLMILALARAGRALNNERYTGMARDAARFILDRLQPEPGKLLHRFRNGDAGIEGKLTDYAFFGLGCTYLYEATFEPEWLEVAVQLANTLSEDFEDKETGGFFMTSHLEEDVLVRQKDINDGAIPSGNALAILLLVRLYHISGENQWARGAERALGYVSGRLNDHAAQFTAHLVALDAYLGPMSEVVIAGESDDATTREMLEQVNRRFDPNSVVLLRQKESEQELLDVAPPVKYRKRKDGKPTAYICRDFTCDQPVQSAEDLRRILEKEDRATDAT